MRKPARRSIRLKGYDYSQVGAYFVTMVTQARACLFAKIVDGSVVLNDFGKIADECWRAIPDHFAHVELGAFVVMPNHVHGIIVITDVVGDAVGAAQVGAAQVGAAQVGAAQVGAAQVGAAQVGATQVGATHASPLPAHGPNPHSLGAIVGSYKSAVTKQIGRELHIAGIWQRNYHDHIIRNQAEMERIWRYIELNPARWADDDDNPKKP
jgi:REP element-mobilizing transposase RayT